MHEKKVSEETNKQLTNAQEGEEEPHFVLAMRTILAAEHYKRRREYAWIICAAVALTTAWCALMVIVGLVVYSFLAPLVVSLVFWFNSRRTHNMLEERARELGNTAPPNVVVGYAKAE